MVVYIWLGHFSVYQYLVYNRKANNGLSLRAFGARDWQARNIGEYLRTLGFSSDCH